MYLFSRNKKLVAESHRQATSPCCVDLFMAFVDNNKDVGYLQSYILTIWIHLIDLGVIVDSNPIFKI